jgi:hypothetical protein
MRNDWSPITRRWLARLSFSFLVLAFFLGWEGYKRYQANASGQVDWRTLVYWFAAMLSVVLAFAGISERHRS